MSFPLPPDGLDCGLVFTFFWGFSAFEYALKREGFLTGRSFAKADWNKFGEAIQDRFEKETSPSFRSAVASLRSLSPRKQINNNGKLGWEEIKQEPAEADAAYTLRLLKTVRNNLFHGGKYPEGTIFEIARDREILRAGLAVLEGCYQLHPGIQHWISEVAA